MVQHCCGGMRLDIKWGPSGLLRGKTEGCKGFQKRGTKMIACSCRLLAPDHQHFLASRQKVGGGDEKFLSAKAKKVALGETKDKGPLKG